MEKGILTYFLLLSMFGLSLPAAELDLAGPPDKWAALIEELKAPTSLRADFEEYRSNPFHRLKRRFDGTIRWHHERGMSLHYTSPRNVRIVVRPEVVYVVKEDSIEAVNDLAGEDGILQLIPRLFSWDTAWLAENFKTEGEWIDTAGWQLTLSPLEENALDRMLNRIHVEGSGNVITRIRMDARGGREIEINLLNQVINPPTENGDFDAAFKTSDE